MCVAIPSILSIAFYLASPVDARKPSYDRRLINNRGNSNQGTSFQALLGGDGGKKQRQSVTTEQTEEGTSELCSCSPRAYDFYLNFNARCDGTLADNEGVDGDICFFADGGTPEEPSSSDVPGFPGTDSLPPGSDFAVVSETEDSVRRLLKQVPYELHHSHAIKVQRQRERQIQRLDTTPTVITSVTFVEFDTKIDTIIQQDSTYFETEKYDGDTVSYNSVSSVLDTDKPLSEQLDLLPGGVMLLMFGINADNILVQNTVAWGYKLDYCEGESLRTGDALGWMSLASDTPPRNAFCPGVTDMPTASPSVVPTIPDPIPVISKSPMISPVALPSPAGGSKSGKTSSKSAKDSDDEEKLSKSAKVFNTAAKATKLFKQKAAKTDSGIADEGAESEGAYLIFDGSKSAKLAKLIKTASTVSSAKASKSEDAKSSKAKLGTVQISRPQVPRPEMPTIPIMSPATNPPPAQPLGSTMHPTSETSQISESVLLAMTASPTVLALGDATNSTSGTSPGQEEGI